LETAYDYADDEGCLYHQRFDVMASVHSPPTAHYLQKVRSGMRVVKIIVGNASDSHATKVL